MLYKRILEGLKKNKAIREGGEHLGIPLPFPRFSEHIPLIERGQAIGLLGASGVGKSMLARFLYLYTPYKFYKDTGYKVKIFVFCLEDSVDKIYHHCLCNYLFLEHNIAVTPKELTSKTSALSQFVLDKIEEAEEYFAEFEQIVQFVWDVHTPKEIYSILREHALKTGKIKEGLYQSDIHTIVLLDNMSNLDEDSEDGVDTERQAMIKLAKDYSRQKLVNVLNFTVVHILQLDFASERQQFTNSGMTILSKIEPSLAGIGEAKVMARSFHLILGLFDPSRYDLLQYPIPSRHDPEACYRIDILGKKFRALKVLKNNDGEPGIRIGLLFNPIAETFTELPAVKTPEIQQIYNSLTKKKIPNLENPVINSTFGAETPF